LPTAQTGQPFDIVLCLSNRGGGMVLKVIAQKIQMLHQLAGRTMATNRRQALDTIAQVLVEVALHGPLRESGQPHDFHVRDFLALQKQHVEFVAHLKVRMIQTFLAQGFDLVLGKAEFAHGLASLPNRYASMPATAKPSQHQMKNVSTRAEGGI
jgi:hypothetical protein